MHRHTLLALILAGAVITVTGSAIAQDNGGTPPPQAAPAGPPPGGHGQGMHMDPEKRTEMLTKHLNLTSDQQAKVLDILKNTQSQMMSLHSDTSMAPQDKHSKMMEIRKGSDDQIRGVLDPAQQKKFDEMQAKRAQWQGHQGGGMAPPPDSQN